MGGIDWIPIICSSIGHNAPGRRYVDRRLPKLRSSLAAWKEAQDMYRDAIEEQSPSPATRRKLDAFAFLVTKELSLLKFAVGKIELWCHGGRDSTLRQAQKAYAQAQILWKRRLALVREIQP